MAINVSVQYDGGLLVDITILTQCYYYRGTRLNTMKMFCICSIWSHLLANKRFDIFPQHSDFSLKYFTIPSDVVYSNRRYFQHANFVPIVGVEKRGTY